MDLYDRPVDLFTAGFVGTPPIGMLPATLVSAGGLAGFEVGTRTLPLWGPVPPQLRDHVGYEVVLGLRAEDVHPAPAGRDPDSVELDAMVVDAEYTGRHTVVGLTVGLPGVAAPGSDHADGGSTDARLHAFFPSRAAVRPGDAVRVAVQAADAHVFDAGTGRALWHPRGAAG
jgi:multiple sugar transport system ATP-binding protein